MDNRFDLWYYISITIYYLYVYLYFYMSSNEHHKIQTSGRACYYWFVCSLIRLLGNSISYSSSWRHHMPIVWNICHTSFTVIRDKHVVLGINSSGELWVYYNIWLLLFEIHSQRRLLTSHTRYLELIIDPKSNRETWRLVIFLFVK